MIDPTLEHARKMRRAIDAGDAARSPVVASWRRCTELYGLDPGHLRRRDMVSAAQLRESNERVGAFLSSCENALQRLRQTFSSAGACILVADVDGVPLRHSGSDADADTLRAWGLWPGFDWCEKFAGTNGIGTCLIEQRPICVHRDEHFYPQPVDISCSAAPLYDQDGNLAGALNITLYGAAACTSWKDLVLASITETARQMEIDHFHRAFARYRVLSLPAPRAGAILLAVDDDRVVVGATRAARTMFALNDNILRQGCCVDDIAGYASEGLAQAERAAIRRTLVRLKGNVTASAQALEISRATLKRKIRQHRLGRRA